LDLQSPVAARGSIPSGADFVIILLPTCGVAARPDFRLPSLGGVSVIRRLLALVAFSSCCPASAWAQSSTDFEAFEKKIRPLLLEHCLSCHGAEGKKIKGGLSLKSRADLLAGGDSGPSLVPGKPAESSMLTAMKHHGELKMPPKGKLPDSDVAAVETWIKAGAPWPGDSGTMEKKSSAGFTDQQKNFWAFQPLRTGRKTIDEYLNSAQTAAGLKPAPAADANVLLRRLSYDLIGLPPTPEELAVFDAAYRTNPDAAVTATVDRLLELPAYGERWGRHWLDVARYADSNGLDENIHFGNAWRYRDYVVRAFNDDKPFDRFIQEQLAGDLLPKSDDPDAQLDRFTALGYLAVGPKLLAEPDKQKMLLDIADEQLDTVSKGMLGLTVACARCHDHKFDPIPTKDYYSLLAVFTSTRTMANLNTVAKVHERILGSTKDTPERVALRKALEKTLVDRKTAERAFARTPVADVETRKKLQIQVQMQRTIVRWNRYIAPPPMTVLGVEDGSDAAYGTRPRNLYVQARGNYVTPLDEAPAGYLRILPAGLPISTKPNPNDVRKDNTTRFGSLREGSGRLELARWLTDPKHPLTARVFVNRVWKHHFGEGLVRSVDNFGKLGEQPSHPDLLDDLALGFIQGDWSVKQLHRRMLTSRAYRASSQPNSHSATVDPENRLLSWYPRRRLEAEPIRDAILAVSGNLDETLGGSLHDGGNQEYVGEPNYDRPRRTLYLPVLRSKVVDFLQTFDFPDPSSPNGRRESTVVAPQALWFLNSDFVRKQAKVFADRLHRDEPKDVQARIRLAYRHVYAREPTSTEVQRAEAFLAADSKQGWALFTQALFAANEFIHLR